MKKSSWILSDSECKDCHSNIIVCQSKYRDYLYYCSQKQCKNHSGIELYDDDDLPEFVIPDNTTDESAISNKP